MSMKRNLVAISALIVLTAVPTVSFALQSARPGSYLSVFLGTSASQDTTVTSNQFNPVTSKNALVSFDPGLNIGGTAGYDFGFVRMECEMSYKQGEITSASDQAFATRYVNVDGHVGTFAMMMNGFFDLHNETPFTPYLGGGMGFANVHLSDTRGVDAVSGALNNHIFQDDSDNVFAYQAGAGVEVALNRRLSLDLGYRYFGTGTATLKKDWPNYTNVKMDSHNATAGLRLKF